MDSLLVNVKQGQQLGLKPRESVSLAVDFPQCGSRALLSMKHTKASIGAVESEAKHPCVCLPSDASFSLGLLRLRLTIFKSTHERFSLSFFLSAVWKLNMQINIITLPTITHVFKHRGKCWHQEIICEDKYPIPKERMLLRRPLFLLVASLFFLEVCTWTQQCCPSLPGLLLSGASAHHPPQAARGQQPQASDMSGRMEEAWHWAGTPWFLLLPTVPPLPPLLRGAWGLQNTLIHNFWIY